ncbi:MAG TPA: hypothetical protein VKS24_24795 [Bradyrhizobium sp.]|nr:hypothetical protein [Bradyrhizobium sp.]
MATHRGRNRAATKIAAASIIAHDHEHDYSALLLKVRESFDGHRGPLFKTDADGLYEIYLDSLPQERQTHTCHACARFFRSYGFLATTNDDGTLRSALWSSDDVADFYADAFAKLRARVEKARIVAPFFSKERIWGTPLTGEWSHPAVIPPEGIVYRERAITAGQAMAAKRENFETVARALAVYKPAALDQLIRLFDAEALRGAEKFSGPIKWLRALYGHPKGRKGENLLWRAIATAPEGFCHPRTSVAAPLLEAIEAGLPFEAIKAKFDEMTHGLRYQRPQSAPTPGNIKAAEAIVEKLGIARSLERRFARLDEVPAIWLSCAPVNAAQTHGVFGHIVAKGREPIPVVDLPAITMTWEKFSRAVLPNAERIEVLAPARGNYRALLTAQHADAPLIFKWNNPISGYVYHNGSLASRWGLPSGGWVPVVAIVNDPSQQENDEAHYLSGDRLLLVLENACDSGTDQGNALFPECLRGDLFPIRATIEAYSKRASIGPADCQLASGLDLSRSVPNCTLRAFLNGAWNRYNIDRWD